MCRFQFATQIFSTSLLFFLTPFLTLSSEVLKRLMYYYLFGQPIDGQRYVHHNSSRIKNVKIPVIQSAFNHIEYISSVESSSFDLMIAL